MRSALRPLAAAAALVLASACGKDGNRTALFGGDVFRSWNPAGVADVKGVQVAQFKGEVDKQLRSKALKATDEQREHASRLYKAYGSAPLWLDDDGLIRSRADALVDAIVNATTDAINIEPYPLFELAANLYSVKRNEHPTAE